MRLAKICVFILIFTYISCTCSNITYGSVEAFDETITYLDPSASVSTCTSRQLSEEEKVNDGYKCCYADIDCKIKEERLSLEDREDLDTLTIKEKACLSVDKNIYENLKYIKEQNLIFYDCKTYELICNPSSSSYLGLTIISLIIFLLL